MTPISEQFRDFAREWRTSPMRDDVIYKFTNRASTFVISATKLDEAADIIDVLLEALEAVAPYLNTMLVDDDPDDETIGWEADGDGGHTKPIDFTMGQIRKVNAAIARVRGAV